MMLCFQNPDGGDDEALPPFSRQNFDVESTRIEVPNEKSDLQSRIFLVYTYLGLVSKDNIWPYLSQLACFFLVIHICFPGLHCSILKKKEGEVFIIENPSLRWRNNHTCNFQTTNQEKITSISNITNTQFIHTD